MKRIGGGTFLAIILLAGTTAPGVAAEPGTPGGPGQIVVSGSSEASLPPSTATFSIGISTRAPTAAGAGEQNARKTKDVMAAMQRAGVSREEIKGTHLSVSRTWDYAANGQRAKASSYEATNSIQIETRRLDQVGTVIDEALTAGATSSSGVSFSADRIDEARHQVLMQAVTAARADAETLARAGGGTLGELLLLSTEPSGSNYGVQMNESMPPPPPKVMAAPALASTEIMPSQITVNANVVGRWRFVPAAGVTR